MSALNGNILNKSTDKPNETCILHYDMDAFFASVEQHVNPSLKGKPIAVGHGVLTTCSYEARAFGVKSAMPATTAKKLCPDLIILPVNIELYHKIGKDIQSLILAFTENCEFVSVDEGYVDITEYIHKHSIETFVSRFKRYIFENTGLTCSVGIGFNRLSAKIASDINKPNGFFIFSDQQHFLDYISEKNISVIPSIGKRTIELLNLFNITKVGQLFKLEKDELISKFGINRGEHLYNLVRSVGSSAISKDRKRQSIGHETTFNITINDTNQLKEELKTLSMRLSKKLKSQNLFIKTISLKIRYSNFSTHTKSKTLSFATNSFDLIYAEVLYIFNSLNDKQNVRLIGVHLSSFAKKSFVQLKL